MLPGEHRLLRHGQPQATKEMSGRGSCRPRKAGNSTNNSEVATKVVRPKFTQKNPPEGTKLNELYKKRRGTSQMSEQFGPNFAPGSFALQQSIGLVYTLRALSRGQNRATRATRDNQDAQTQKEHTHARQRRHNSQPETPPPPPPPPPLLLLLLSCCCCCCAAA